MADELHLLPGDNPQAYIPGDRRRALARGQELPPVTLGAAVFVDISGFTPLTEALARELGGRRGAEELSATLDRIFSALMEPLHAWNGSVVYFSGDAVTAWIDGDDGSRAVECGLAMQQVMAPVGVVQTPGGVPITLGVKVAVAVGEVHRFVVGDLRVQLIDVLGGALMDSLAAAEQQSESGEVVLDTGAIAALGDRVELREVRRGELGDVGVVAALTDEALPARHSGPVAAAARGDGPPVGAAAGLGADGRRPRRVRLDAAARVPPVHQPPRARQPTRRSSRRCSSRRRSPPPIRRPPRPGLAYAGTAIVPDPNGALLANQTVKFTATRGTNTNALVTYVNTSDELGRVVMQPVGTPPSGPLSIRVDLFDADGAVIRTMTTVVNVNAATLTADPDGISTRAGTAFPLPGPGLRASLMARTTPIDGYPVTFTVLPAANGAGATFPGGGSSVTVNTEPPASRRHRRP